MLQRRRATQAELDQGEEEMRQAAERLQRENTEPALEDQGIGERERHGQVNGEIPHRSLQEPSTSREIEVRPGNQVEVYPLTPNVQSTTPVNPGQQQTPEDRVRRADEFLSAARPNDEVRGVPFETQGTVEVQREPRTVRTGGENQTPLDPNVEQVSPLFTPQQLQHWQNIEQQTALLSGMQIPAVVMQPRPLFLEQEELISAQRRQQQLDQEKLRREQEELLEAVRTQEQYDREKLRLEEVKKRSQEAKDENERLVQENRRLAQRLKELEKVAAKDSEDRFLTPDAKDAKVEVKVEGRPPIELLQRPSSVAQDLKEAETTTSQAARIPQDAAYGSKEAVDPPKSKDQGRKEQHQGSASAGYPEPPRTTGSTPSDPMIQVVLKLMEGMQEIQKKLVTSSEGRSSEDMEVVKFSGELPRLAEWTSDSGPIDYNDWLLCLTPQMADLSQSSQLWWETTVAEARRWYEEHMQLSPIARLSHFPKMTEELNQPKWVRVERRAAAMLMNAIPDQLREEVVAGRAVSCLGILSKGMQMYQPGGMTEKMAILTSLESPAEAQSISGGITTLRKWLRWRRRASEVGVSLPDATILVRGLSKMTKKLVQTYPDLSFRLSLMRNSLMVDTIPTQETVARYSEHLLAELEQMGHAKKKEPTADAPLKLKKAEESSWRDQDHPGKAERGQASEEKEKGRCKFFLTEGGCRKGKDCKWSHDQRDEKMLRMWSYRSSLTDVP